MAQTAAGGIPYAMPNASDGRRLAGILLVTAILGVAAGIAIGRGTAPIAVPASATGVAVTDGWMHSDITRLGAAPAPAVGPAVADGWQFSPFTRLYAFEPGAGVAVTDGWMHSPFTRNGPHADRLAALIEAAADYQSQRPSVEARGN
jgi:hypothetical protein